MENFYVKDAKNLNLLDHKVFQGIFQCKSNITWVEDCIDDRVEAGVQVAEQGGRLSLVLYIQWWTWCICSGVQSIDHPN